MSATKQTKPAKPTTHTAVITCGHCGHETKIALGSATAIVCKGCKNEIVIVEVA